MARSTIEVPWETPFPQVCARCTEPAEKVKRITRSKPSAQMWGVFGLIGAAIASSRKGGSLKFAIPYCEDCFRKDRIYLWAAWGGFLLGLLLSCGIPLFGTQFDSSNTLGNTVLALRSLSSWVLILIVVPVLAIIRHNHQAVHIKKIFEPSESVQLAFRSQPYFERFWQDNLERIVTLALKYGKKMPVPLDQAILTVGKRIDDQNPTSTQSLSGYFERGQMYLQTEKYDRALADLERVIGVTGFENPYFLEAQFFRGQAHTKLGHTMQAQTDLENYVKASSDRSKVQQSKRLLKELKRI